MLHTDAAMDDSAPETLPVNDGRDGTGRDTGPPGVSSLSDPGAAAKEERHGTDSPPPPAAEEDEPEARNSGVGGVHIAMIYPATLGSSDFDYHVGDKIATPSELHATQFSEAAMLLPFSAYPTDYRFAHPHPLRRDKGNGPLHILNHF